MDFIKKDFFNYFPEDIKNSTDPTFRELADELNFYMTELVVSGDSDRDGRSIDQLADLFKCEKIPSRFLNVMGEMFDAGIETSDTDRKKAQKICRAVSYHRIHGTVALIRLLIEEVTGTPPDILAFTSFNKGWDEIDEIDGTGLFLLDFEGGLFWDEIEEHTAVVEEGFVWSIIPSGILVDVKNDGVYTTDQWDKILQIVAEQKRAELAAEVGYFDSVTGEKVVYSVVYNSSLTVPSPIADPGI